MRGDYYVLSVNEAVNLDGTDAQLEISNIDRLEKSEGELLFDSLEQMEIRALKPNITQGPPTAYVYNREVAPGFPAKVPIEFTDATLEVQRVRLRIVTTPFRATSSGAASGGSHRHRVSFYTGTQQVATPIFCLHSFAANDAGSGAPAQAFVGQGASDLWTFDAADPHTHAVQYGISDDSQYPIDISFHFQGNDVTNLLFGSATLAPGGGAINEVANSGELARLLSEASGGLLQYHQIEIRCASGRGRIEATIERYESTQSIKASQS